MNEGELRSGDFEQPKSRGLLHPHMKIQQSGDVDTLIAHGVDHYPKHLVDPSRELRKVRVGGLENLRESLDDGDRRRLDHLFQSWIDHNSGRASDALRQRMNEQSIHLQNMNIILETQLKYMGMECWHMT